MELHFTMRRSWADVHRDGTYIGRLTWKAFEALRDGKRIAPIKHEVYRVTD